MYLQDIVISPDIFEKISRAYSEEFDLDIDLKSYKENLELKKIIFDKDESEESELSQLIKNVIDNSSAFGKQKIDSVLRIFLKEGRVDYKLVNDLKNYCEDKISNKLLNLVAITDSKIINSEKPELKSLRSKHSELSEVELLNFEEFISPPECSKLYCLNKEIKIKIKNTFNFEDFFKPYLYETQILKITDKYLRKRKGGYLNLIRLLKLCTNLKKIEIKTVLKSSSEKYKPDIETAEMETEIKSLIKDLNVSFQSTGDHQRKLETDDFLITLDPGFDFVNEKYIAERHDVIINFKKKN